MFVQQDEVMSLDKPYLVKSEEMSVVFFSNHLSANAKRRLLGGFSIYHLQYNDVMSKHRVMIGLQIKNGYKVLFEHENKKILLLYNKNDRSKSVEN